MMGMGEKPRNIYKNKETKEKSPVWLPSHPPIYKIWRLTVFRDEKTGNKSDLP